MDVRQSRSLGGVVEGLGDLVGGLAGDVQDLVRGEIALARSEFDVKLHRLVIAAVWLLGGALLAFAGLVVLLEGAAARLALMLPAWASLMIVGGIIVLFGAIFAASGLGRLSLKTLTPERSAANLHKDVAILKERT